MKISLKRGTYWVRGVKYALVLYIASFALQFIPIFGWLFIHITETWLLLPFEHIFGESLIGCVGCEGLFSLPFYLPNIFGWLILLVLHVSTGFVFGVFFELFMRPSAKSALIAGTTFAIVFSSIYFLNFVTSSASLKRCNYVFDGYGARNRSLCYLQYLEGNRNLASLDYCNTYFTKPAGGKDYHSKCLKYVAAYTKNDKICDQIPEDPGDEFDSFFAGENTTLRDSCYQDIIGTPSKDSHDVSLCDSRLSEDTRDRCFQSVAVITKNAKICENILSKGIQSLCYSSIAEDVRNINLCNFIRSEDARDRCYSSLAVTSSDAKICENILSTDLKSSCYLWIAEKTRNTNLCNFVRSEDKERCVGYGH